MSVIGGIGKGIRPKLLSWSRQVPLVTGSVLHCKTVAVPGCSTRKSIEGPVKEPNMFHNYEIEKITRKALTCFTVRGRKPTIILSCSVLPPEFGSSTRDRHARRIYRYASCMKISGGRTEQHVKIGFGELAAVD